MVLEDIRSLIDPDLNSVNELIVAESQSSDVELINEVGHHIVSNRGKRLRPLLLLLTARVFGDVRPEHITLSAAIEFIHTATLLHDDVVDESMLRRGTQTANALFGNDASVLVGDFLYSRAFQLMVKTQNMQVMDVMSETTNTIAAGEVMQLSASYNTEITETEYLTIIERKTAKLFEAAARLGALVHNRTKAEVSAVARYGFHLGNAFQITDDVLDYAGSIAVIGKNIGDDMAMGKLTLPMIYLLQNGNKSQVELARTMLDSGSVRAIEQLKQAMVDSGALAGVRERAEIEVHKAQHALKALPMNNYTEALHELARFVLEREY